jgi:hypothetical protein
MLFVPIALSVLALIVGYAMYTHYQSYSNSSSYTTRRRVGSLRSTANFDVNSESAGAPLRSGTADNLDKIAGTHMPGKCGLHVVGIQFKVPLRRLYRFVERKANLSASKQYSGNCPDLRGAQTYIHRVDVAGTPRRSTFVR